MKTSLRVSAASLFAAFFSVALGAAIAQNLAICPSCSWEAAPSAKFCSHCGADLKTGEGAKTQPAASAQFAENTAADVGDAAPEARTPFAAAMLEDIAWAKTFNTQNKSTAALASLANAGAVNAVAPADSLAEADRRLIFDGIASLRKALITSPTQCHVCKGQGVCEVLVESQSLAGTVSAAALSKKETCKFCAGSGRLARVNTTAVKARVAEGEREFARTAQIAGRKRFGRGELYLPDALAAALTKEQTNTLVRAAAAACSTCSGFQLEACAVCDGTGIAKCPERNCANGVIKTAPSAAGASKNKTLESLKTQAELKCPTCGGLAYAHCAACGGGGVKACRRCGTAR
jgi:Archaea-specific RecJ-like exonuclease, contains DnaJ-type Zn finger domain